MALIRNPRMAIATVVVAMSLAGLAALALASGGGADDGVLDVELRDGAIALEDGAVPSGTRVVEAQNAGTEEHELVVVRTSSAAGELPVGLHGVDIDLAGRLIVGEDHAALDHDHGDEVTGLLPGASLRQRAELRPGSYVAFCQTGNHYLAGERAELVVEPALPS